MKENNNIKFGISKKRDGQMILREDGEGLKNRIKHFSNIGIDIDAVVSANIVHNNNVEVVFTENAGEIIKKTDGLVTNVKNLFLTITISDCVPIFIYDENKKVVGIAHAGWKSIVKNIVTNLVQKLKNQYNSDTKDLKVYIGSHIKKCHFEIKEDVLNKFREYPEFIIKKDNKIFVDLEKIIEKQFIYSGLNIDNIKIDPSCTYCNKEYFSFRRDKPQKPVSQIAYIGLI